VEDPATQVGDSQLASLPACGVLWIWQHMWGPNRGCRLQVCLQPCLPAGLPACAPASGSRQHGAVCCCLFSLKPNQTSLLPTPQVLEIWVGDSPMTGRTEVGTASFPLSQLAADGTADVWLPVESSMPGEQGNQAGGPAGMLACLSVCLNNCSHSCTHPPNTDL
jgi:hypothetical protein